MEISQEEYDDLHSEISRLSELLLEKEELVDKLMYDIAALEDELSLVYKESQ